MNPEPSIRNTWCGAAERGMRSGESGVAPKRAVRSDRPRRPSLRHCALPTPGRRSRLAGSGCLHRAVDKETGAIRAFDLPIAPEIQKDPRMAERPTAAIASSDSLINVDGFERPHRRPENGGGRWPRRAADHMTSMMIRFAARQSKIRRSRTQLRARGIDADTRERRWRRIASGLCCAWVIAAIAAIGRLCAHDRRRRPARWHRHCACGARAEPDAALYRNQLCRRRRSGAAAAQMAAARRWQGRGQGSDPRLARVQRLQQRLRGPGRNLGQARESRPMPMTSAALAPRPSAGFGRDARRSPPMPRRPLRYCAASIRECRSICSGTAWAVRWRSWR